MTKNNELLLFKPSLINESHTNTELVDYFFDDASYDKHSQRKIYYISDLHIDHKLKRKKFFNKNETEYLNQQIDEIVTRLCCNIDWHSYPYLLIAGDTSFSYEINELFYTKLVEKWMTKRRIVVVLGNHELWEHSSVEEAETKYSELFKRLEITFLDNKLLIADKYGWPVCYTSEEIINMADAELKEKCLRSSLCILGGTGFSALNTELNADSNLYRKAVVSREEEKAQTKKFSKIYDKMFDVCEELNNIIIMTHMPKEDWSEKHYNPKWKYVNGHTHKNQLYYSEEKKVFSNNQLGYTGKHFTLKYFFADKAYDIYKFYPDGIHTISVYEYIQFNYGMNIQMDYKRSDIECIYMIKREGMYMFLGKKCNSNKLYFMEGGKTRKIAVQDVEYYFENIIFYIEKIKEPYEIYYNFLKELSAFVKQFGGEGTIHGAIVDIDFFNHIYVNPLDGTISFYYATSIVDKYLYPNLKKLLKAKRKDLLHRYIKCIESTTENTASLIRTMDSGAISLPQSVPETDIYRMSNLLRKFQYIHEKSVLRVWDEEFINKEKRNLIGQNTPI